MNVSNQRIKSFIMQSGERYCLLVDKEFGSPLYYPNLFVTTQIRNNSLSLAAMETALAAINVLLTFCNESDIDLESRFMQRNFFALHELDAIRDYCQWRLVKTRVDTSPGPLLLSGNRKQQRKKTAGLATEYVRLTEIGKYSKWLAEVLLSGSLDRQVEADIARMHEGFESRRPNKKGRNQLNQVKGLDDEQLAILFEVIRPDSEFNPFHDPAVQIRNRLIILILVYLGPRGGEVLNVRICDIDWSNNRLVIARRADEKDDPRLDQPLVKTLDRLVVMKETLGAEIHKYINKYRDKVPNARYNDYLFVTHKAGPTQGQPLSISAYQKLISLIASVAPALTDLHGHTLRHTWNDQFSEFMDKMDNPPSPEDQETRRSYLQGWKPGSGTAATYTRRFTQAKAMEHSLNLQKGITRIPENLKSDR